MVPASRSAESKAEPSALKAIRKSVSDFSSTTPFKPASNSTTSPSCSLRKGLAMARQPPLSAGSIRVISMRASTNPCADCLLRRPIRRAGITLVLFRIRRSPARKRLGKSENCRSPKLSPCTASNREARRGRAGRVAIKSSGRSKSKSSSFTHLAPALGGHCGKYPGTCRGSGWTAG